MCLTRRKQTCVFIFAADGKIGVDFSVFDEEETFPSPLPFNLSVSFKV